MKPMSYSKPEVRDLGTLRELTQFGSGANCDGGAFGIVGDPSDGSSTKCFRNS